MSSQFEPIAMMAQELAKLPGVGPKTAQRLAYHLASQPQENVRALSVALWEGRKAIRFCKTCGNYATGDACPICADVSRHNGQICVVRDPRDVAALERMHEYRGLYHVLHGVFNPVGNMNMNDITISELFARLTEHPEIKEVIVATNQNAEGNATALYISRLLGSTGIKVTRLASGLPMGSDIKFEDDLTLANALKGRKQVGS